MKTVLITGADGFIGKALCASLVNKGYNVRGAVLSSDLAVNLPPGVEPVVSGDIGGNADWRGIVSDIDIVIHLAARVHVMREDADDPLSAFVKVNTEGTVKLVKEAIKAGVKKFIYMSSIKVNGESTPNRPFSAEDSPGTQDPYGISKLRAEEKICELCRNSGMGWLIIRPTLVYGPSVRGNFLRLMKWVKKGVPLPLGSIENKRSLVYLGNLVDAIRVMADKQDVKNEIFLISDGKDISTPDLISMIGQAMGKKVRLMRVSAGVLSTMAALLARRKKPGGLQVHFVSIVARYVRR